MGDKYEILDAYQNNAIPSTPAASDVPPGISPPDTTPLPDPEPELLKSTTDLYSKKFETGSKQYPSFFISNLFYGNKTVEINEFVSNVKLQYFIQLNHFPYYIQKIENENFLPVLNNNEDTNVNSRRANKRNAEKIDDYDIYWCNDIKYYCIYYWYNYWLLCVVKT